MAAALHHVAVSDNDAIEIPRENALQTLARRAAIANEQRIELGRTQAPIAPQQLHEQAGWRGCVRTEVEREIAQDQRTTGPMEEGDLVLVWAAAKEDLVDFAPPLHRCFVV